MDRDRQRQTDRQTGQTEIDRQTNRQTDRQAAWQTDKTDRTRQDSYPVLSARRLQRWTACGMQGASLLPEGTDGQTDRQADTHTDRQDRQLPSPLCTQAWTMDSMGMHGASFLVNGGGEPLHIPRQSSGTLFTLQQPVLLRSAEDRELIFNVQPTMTVISG